MLLYGTFIPNTWQRAAKVILPMAAMPFVVMGSLRLSSTAVSDLSGQIANFEQISDNVIMMVLGCVASLYGTHIINTLRVEAFRARQMGSTASKSGSGQGGWARCFSPNIASSNVLVPSS